MTGSGPHVLLTGGTGYLGHYLVAEIRRRDLPLTVAARRGGDIDLDLTEPATIRAAVEAVRPDLVLNAGALSRVGECEDEPERAHGVNAAAPEVFAATGVRLLQISTDLVFDGRSPPYAADASPAPLSEYGRTKAAAEKAVSAAGGLVVRLPLLFGRSFDGRRGATDMIRAHERVTLYTNEYRTPLHAADAASSLVDLLLDRDAAGVRQLSGPERVSRFELGRRFVDLVGLSLDRLSPAECDDPLRPRDLTMIPDEVCGRTLDEALRGS